MPPKKESGTHPEPMKIKVFPRLRPSIQLEEEMGVRGIIKVVSSKEIVTRDKKFVFDQVFKQDAEQLEVYMSVLSPMIPEVVAGYNCTVFAYGPTGSGKTYTMTGNKCESTTNWRESSKVGCIPRAAAHIFEELSRGRNESSVKVSYLELYNEEIRDLLSEDDSLLSIYNDTKGSVFIQGLKEVSVQDTESLCKQLQKGTTKRQTAPTLMNHQSSRSHTVFTITVHTRESNISGEDILKTGKLNLVDLAGSENIARSGCKDVRFVELANINKSLLTLGRVIQTLSEKGQKHIPYRDSKLTRILQDSLGGHTKTCIIANISPTSTCYEETLSTLEYAARARDIKNTPIVNEKLTRAQVIQSLYDEIDRLQKDLDAARDKSGFFVNKDNYEQLLQTVEMITGEKVTMEELLRKQRLRIEELEEIMHTRTKEFDDNVSMCKKGKELLAKAKKVIKEKKETLKQEQFVAQVYEIEATQLHSQAQQLLSRTKLLSVERAILEEKLQKQHAINTTNRTAGQSAVSQVSDILKEISNEGETLKIADEKVRKTCKVDLEDLKTEIRRPLEEIKKMLQFFGENVLEQLVIKDELRDTMTKYIIILREKTQNIKAMLNSHLEKLETFTQGRIEDFLETFGTIARNYSNAVYDLAVVLHKTLAAEDEALKEKIAELEQYLLIRKRQEEAMMRQKMELETKILQQVRAVRKQAAERNYEARGNQFLDNLKIITEKSYQRCEAMIVNLDRNTMFEVTTALTDALPEIMLSDLDDFDNTVILACDKLDEIHEQSQSTGQAMTDAMREVRDIINIKMMTIDGRFEFLTNDRDTFEQKFETFVKKTDEILKEDFLERFVPVKHEGDTPARRTEFVTRTFEPPTPREILIEKFKEEQALLGDQSTSGSGLTLGDPEVVPGDSSIPPEATSGSNLNLGDAEVVPTDGGTPPEE